MSYFDLNTTNLNTNVHTILYITVCLILCVIAYVLYTKTNIQVVCKDLIIGHSFYNYNEFKSIRELLKSHNVASKMTYDEREPQRKSHIIMDKTLNRDLEHILISKNLKRILEKALDGKVAVDHIYPIEYREYDTQSQGMKWHVDKSLFFNPYFECILTLENNTYSMFQYYDNEGVIQSVVPKPNTLICVTPNTIPHQVTPTLKGSRTILKFVVTFEHNRPNNKAIKNEMSGSDDIV